MALQPQDSLMEDRVAQLEAVLQSRNELLREMYYMMRRREDNGSIFSLSEDDDSEEDLHVFLARHDLRKNPETGRITNLPQSELFASLSDQPQPGEESQHAHYDRTPEPASRSKPPSTTSTKSSNLDLTASPIGINTDIKKAATRGKSQVIDLTRSATPQEREADNDLLPIAFSPRQDGKEGPESDDILMLGPSESRPPLSRPHSASLPPVPRTVDEDDRDELDLIGSLSPAASVSDEHKTRSRTISEVIPMVESPGTVDAPEEEEVEVEVEGSRDENDSEQMKEISPEPMMELEETVQSPALQPMTMQREEEVEQTYPMRSPSIEESTSTLEEQRIESRPPSSNSFHSPMASPPTRPLPLVMGSNMSPRSQPLVIPAPSSPIHCLPPYAFELESLPSPETKSPSFSPKQPRQYHFNPKYTLPPLQSLPVEFHRKGKPARQHRKREKEREKNERGFDNGGRRDKELKEDWVPMGLNRWGATIRANPVWKKVARAQKCLSTRDWGVAITELRLIRTLDRIEHLKDNGRWSFRQPKKQRGVGGLMKTHWDFLMDEMKWMRIDFREERKWKMALAYNISTAVLEWHGAGSLEERVRRGICVLWKRPRAENTDANNMEEEDSGMDFENAPIREPPSNSLLMVDYGSDDDDEMDKDQQSVVDALETTAIIEDALEAADAEKAPPRDVDNPVVEPKMEDIEESSHLHPEVTDEAPSAVEVDTSAPDSNTPKMEENAVSKLQPASVDPILSSTANSMSTSGEGEQSASFSPSKPAVKANIYAPLRQHIAYLDDTKLFLDLDDFILPKNFSTLSVNDVSIEDPPPAPDLSSIFPDLQPLALLDVPSPAVASTKRSDRKDRDDPNRRTEDTTYSKLTSMSQFMHCKPTLLGPLQPAKRWKTDHWSNIEQAPIFTDYDYPYSRATDDISCDLFEGNKPTNPLSSGASMLPTPPKDGRKRSTDLVWTQAEDQLLKTLAEKYPNNWLLIADSFNSSRVTILTDKRTPWDCLERWSVRWGSGSRLAPQAGQVDQGSPVVDGAPLPTTPSVGQMTTRGVKRASIAANNATPGGFSSGNEPRKRRRHNLMLDAMRKASKRKEAAQKANQNQRKSQVVHDTHGQYNKMPKLSPQELSRMKADKEQKEQSEMVLARRRHEEMARQHVLREQAQRMQVGSTTNVQAQMLPQQQVNGVPRQGVGLPPVQGVPQIRSQVNISQQQRIPTPLAAGSTRMSPQQVIQAQTQVRAMAQAQAQSAISTLNGIVGNSHLSPPYVARAASSSPGLPRSSPPRSSATPANASNPPRPPSAQQQIGMIPVPGNSMPRPVSNMGQQYFSIPSMQGQQQFPADQMEHVLRAQALMAQGRQGGMSQGPQSGPYPSHP